jgi:predicted metal-dependent phosphoesterase TrpH
MLKDEQKVPMELSEVLVFTRDAIGRPHIARALLERGYAVTVEDAFKRYLVPCNVPKCYWPIDDAIQEIRRIGGISVLAHPTSVSSDRQELRELVIELSCMGLDGVEVFNNMAHSDEMEFLRRLADEQGLLITGGSDFHGIEEGLQIGRGRGGIRFNNSLLAPIRKRLSERIS